MNLIRCLLITLLIINCTLADELKMKNGRVYKNIRIAAVELSSIIIYYDNERQFIPIMDVEEWTKQIPYDETKPSEIYLKAFLIKSGEVNQNPCTNEKLLELENKQNLTEQEINEYVELKKSCEKFRFTTTTVKKYWNLPLLVFGIGGFAGTYHFINKGLDQKSGSLGWYGNMKREGDTNLIYGILCGVGGALITVFALKPVEVQVQPNLLSVRINI